MHAQQSTGTTRLIFGQTLCLIPYFMCANSEGSGETARMHSLAWALAVHLYNKYHNLISWLKYNVINKTVLRKNIWRILKFDQNFLSLRKYILIKICQHLTVLNTCIHNFSRCEMKSTLHWLQYSITWNEPHREKTCLRGFRTGKTQTGLLSFRD